MYVPHVENRKRRLRLEREQRRMSRKKQKQRRKICNVHDDIMELADELIEMELPNGYKTGIKKLARSIRALAEEAKDSGQAMENRLYEYYYAVEGLGFVRFKEIKK